MGCGVKFRCKTRWQAAGHWAKQDLVPSVSSLNKVDPKLAGRFPKEGVTMSNAYIVNREQGEVFELWTGEISNEEIFTHQRAVLSDPGFQEARRFLVDIIAASFDPMGGTKMMSDFVGMCGGVAEKSAGMKVAVLASANFAREAIYDSQPKPKAPRTVVFNDISSACAWLGIEEEAAEKWLDGKRGQILSSRTGAGALVSGGLA